jgi:hypothetical protein
LPDTNLFKKELQKYRIIIMASFAKLIPILSSQGSDTDLEEWNQFASIVNTSFSRQELTKRGMKNQMVEP